MENLLYIPLIAPVVWFFLKFYNEHYVYDPKLELVHQLLPLLLFVIYCVFLIVIGPSATISFFEDIGSAGRSMGFWTFIIPGFIFVCVIFPTQVSEVTNTNNDMIPIVRVFGWVMLIAVFVRHRVVLT